MIDKPNINLLILIFIAAHLFVYKSSIAASSQVEEFYRIARPELDAGGECKAAAKYLHGLPPNEQLDIARSIVNDPDARVAYLGTHVLIEHGHADEAVPVLAAMIASGRDETQLQGRLGYDWVHNDDETLFLRMIIKLSSYLLENLEAYQGVERARVEKFLMGGLFDKPIQPFSRTEAERRVSALEMKLQKLRPHDTSQ